MQYCNLKSIIDSPKEYLIGYGFNVKYIEIENIKRNNGSSKWSFKKLFSYAIEGFISFTTAPLKISVILGVVISIFSLVAAIIIILQTVIYGKDVPGYASIITTILFMGGIQLLSIGILSEYTSKIYLEIKNRPKYILKEEINLEKRNKNNNEKIQNI